ncbi:MAG: choice-of-anchor L domain-containing protein, partial [Bacteroidales bacterium]|nr:choice-of-anchor L domain-containing protein [Bacteroidales bacterium]
MTANQIFGNIISKVLIIAISALLIKPVQGQLVIDNTLTPEQLVQNILVGTGVSAFNVTYTGNQANAICSFSNGITTNLGIDEGIILSSGISGEAANPQAFNASTSNNTAGDPDLDLLPGVLGTNDASTLEFDFIPQSDTLVFRYVFGSEEYPEFVNQFNDVFAFFISGPNPAGGNYVNENIALIPGTNLPVSINNVNNGNANTGPCVNCEFYIDNTGGGTICYDGFTVVLEAIAVVVPCSTYHMKLTIADDLDYVLDSGVFLEANSFSAQGLNISSTFSSSSISYGSLIEGCNEATVYFELIDTLIYNYPIYFEYLGTAVNGVDYVLLPDSLVIPAGSVIDSLNIIPVQNNAIDPTRTVIIVFDYESACATEVDTLELTLLDNSIELSGLDTLYCSSDPPVNLTVYPPEGVLTGPGTSGTTFDPGLAAPGMNIISFTNYFIDNTLAPPDTVCINEAIDTTWVTYAPTVDAGSDESRCQEELFDLGTSFVIPFVTGQDSLRWTGGLGTFDDPAVIHPVYFPDASEIGDVTLTITAFGQEPCGNVSSSMTLTLDTLPIPLITASPMDSSCVGDPVQFSASANIQIASWQWDFGDGSTATGQSASHTYTDPGTYNVSLIAESFYNCIDTAYFTKIITDPLIDFFSNPNPSCVGDTVWFTGTGDAATYTEWTWDFGDGNGDVGSQVWHIYDDPGTQPVTLDVCTKSASHTHEVIPPAIAEAGSNESICEGVPFDFATASSPATVFDNQGLEWSTSGSGIISDPNVIHPVYTPPPGELGPINFMLVAFGISPCSNDTSYMELTILNGPEADYTITPADSICVNENVSFDASSTTTITDWQWEFGDGNSGSGQNVSHTFNTAGNYLITLIVTNTDGCRDTVEYPVEVFELPVADFVVSPANNICRLEELSFNASSSTNILDWYWDLGDGTTANTQNTTHTYAAAGTYSVSLYVYNENSCRDTITQSVTIYELPTCD